MTVYTQDALFPISDIQTSGYAQPEPVEVDNTTDGDDTVAEAA